MECILVVNMRNFWASMCNEFSGIHPRYMLLNAVCRLLPTFAFVRTRVRLYRLMGIRIGRGSLLAGHLDLTGYSSFAAQLSIGDNCYINKGCQFNLGGTVTLDADVAVGMNCLFVTNSHQIGTADYRAGAGFSAPIRIRHGVWLGAGVTILPGVQIGEGTVIAAGAVVAHDIPANVLAGGVPARVLRALV